MLFATLDPTMREIALPSGRKVILSDTVGFISDLPTQLVAAFRATLEEVLEADLILHVRDVSHPDSAAQAEDVMKVLSDLGVADDRRTQMIEVRNKIDLMEGEARRAMLNETARDADAVAVSALTGEGVPNLLARVEARLGANEVARRLLVPAEDGAALAWLHAHMKVDAERATDEGMLMETRGDPEDFGRFFKRFPGASEAPDRPGMPRAAQ
jgi:GTP-binding protein HflX